MVQLFVPLYFTFFSRCQLLVTAQLFLILVINSKETGSRKECELRYTNYHETWAPLVQKCRAETKVDLANHPIYQANLDYAVDEFEFDDKV